MTKCGSEVDTSKSHLGCIWVSNRCEIDRIRENLAEVWRALKLHKFQQSETFSSPIANFNRARIEGKSCFGECRVNT